MPSTVSRTLEEKARPLYGQSIKEHSRTQMSFSTFFCTAVPRRAVHRRTDHDDPPRWPR